ncbi:hypothetical protein XELAEV_18046693mg [Xenopus laevis]|uniref:L1 transposable element RRM domain-containing protein n=1 Tax=Xenopus laevis TaxID=8355 RepID=A0A974BU10_XENLA|nr:hypothetical protein XELAEV_18046693mg [Xenopus laevis]
MAEESEALSQGASPQRTVVAAGGLPEIIAALPTKEDLLQLLESIKSSQRTETEIIKTEISTLATRLLTIEARQTEIDSNLTRHESAISTQARQIYLLRRGLEDAENCSRRNNVRIRGIPEDIQIAEAKQLLIELFNTLLGRDKDQDQFHRVAGGRPDKPRDILCCIHKFTTKEQILSKAREIKNLRIEEDSIELYQDLALTTITQRQLLRETTGKLRERNIQYKWGFPFALIARHNGKNFIMKEPGDGEQFFRGLGVPPSDLSDWARYVYGPSPKDPQHDPVQQG